MAEGSATQPSRLIRSICLPVREEEYQQLIHDPAELREDLDACCVEVPELFPEGFGDGYEMKDSRSSKKMGLRLRRVELRNGVSYTLRPPGRFRRRVRCGSEMQTLACLRLDFDWFTGRSEKFDFPSTTTQQMCDIPRERNPSIYLF